MSKRKEKTPAPLADWVVSLYDGGQVPVPQARMERDKHGGYTFTDRVGPLHDFAPGIAAHVRRVDAAPAPPAETALAAVAARVELAAKRQNGKR